LEEELQPQIGDWWLVDWQVHRDLLHNDELGLVGEVVDKSVELQVVGDPKLNTDHPIDLVQLLVEVGPPIEVLGSVAAVALPMTAGDGEVVVLPTIADEVAVVGLPMDLAVEEVVDSALDSPMC
jgi:hypothetical protein